MTGPSDVTRDSLPAGTRLNHGTYRIDAVLGRGGFGVTYKGDDVKLGTPVAIKEFFPEGLAQRDPRTLDVLPATNSGAYADWLDRFQREARLLASLSHPNIVRVRYIFEEHGTAYFVMDFVAGQTLQAYLEEQPGGCLAPATLERIMAPLVGALETVHARDLYHLDLKPLNVLLRDGGEPVLIDFGAAKRLPKGQPVATVFAYTPAYAAPELLGGGEVSARTDLFALGVMLHELLTGELPPNALARQQTPWTPESVPEPWRTLIARAAELIIAKRPGSVRAWWDGRLQIPVPPPAPPKTSDKKASSRPKAAGAAADIFDLRDGVIDEYARYVRGFFFIRKDETRAFVDQYFDDGHLWPEPLIQLNPPFKAGATVEHLVTEGLLHSECARIFRRDKREAPPGETLRLHQHQEDAIRVAAGTAGRGQAGCAGRGQAGCAGRGQAGCAGRGQAGGGSYVLTTGTGSGKSLAYFIPIVDHVLKNGTGQGIRAIVVYPMNALANSQKLELEKFLEAGYPPGKPPVTFRRYTGQEKEDERDEIRQAPPDILLTNFMMLELILTRTAEASLRDKMGELAFLVLDELHTYRGRQGADVAMLVRRVRQRSGSRVLRCVGTSATIAGEGAYEARRAEVAHTQTRNIWVRARCTVRPHSAPHCCWVRPRCCARRYTSIRARRS